MSNITVFDPAMCCSSGVCGPKPDQKLSVFSADLQFLESQGHAVTRHNLAQEPAAFAGNLTVKALLEAHKTDALPIILRDGELVSYGTYPTRTELALMAAGNKPKTSQGEKEQAEEANAESNNCCCTGSC
ncbi:arsenical resistance operon transcriptional repressor ArsD [Photobacterium sanctipauli]|uniref:Arsenical resistance operon transcriptional repressor ArsD n=1 Tax=Photobacterium sanctipauli TaxID=1342794 RepID=A0A2T3NPP5_9GAMM|nr:arsenite efflux transporter metallochaperone ArsD [Photobacterium sanctipauli]PSW18192.1 arsenical resistance operon transcriptional repressor ArsD [Photobacterium sanctipauli]